MKDYKFIYTGDVSVEKRSNGSFYINILVAIIFFSIVTYQSNWVLGLVIASIFLLVQFFKSNRWEQYLIVQIDIDEINVSIEYYDGAEKKKTSGKKSDFAFKLKTAWNKTATHYLEVNKEGSILIKQFEIGNWTEDKFKEVINRYKECEL